MTASSSSIRGSHSPSRSQSRSSTRARDADSDLFGDLNEEARPPSTTPSQTPALRSDSNPDHADNEETDADVSARSRPSASLRRPSIPEIAISDDESTMPAHFADDYTPEGPSAPAMSSRSAADYSPTAQKKPSLASLSGNKLYAPRPGMERGSSERPLLDDMSAANTPATGGEAVNPFDRSPLAQSTSISSNEDGQSSTNDVQPQNNHLTSPEINIIPFTPADSARATFDDQTFDPEPEAGPSSHSGSRSNSDPSTSSGVSFQEKEEKGAGWSKTSALDGNKITSIQARRSMRMKQKDKPVTGSKRDTKRDSGKPAGAGLKRMPFQSTRLKGEIYKPWLEKKDPAQRWARWITIASIILGIGAAGASECFLMYSTVLISIFAVMLPIKFWHI